MNNKIFVRVMCIILGALMVVGSVALIAAGVIPVIQELLTAKG